MSPADESDLRRLLLKSWDAEQFVKAGCSGKHAFTDPQSARKALPHGDSRHGRPMVYRCRYCHKWHVGSKLGTKPGDRKPVINEFVAIFGEE